MQWDGSLKINWAAIAVMWARDACTGQTGSDGTGERMILHFEGELTELPNLLHVSLRFLRGVKDEHQPGQPENQGCP